MARAAMVRSTHRPSEGSSARHHLPVKTGPGNCVEAKEQTVATVLLQDLEQDLAARMGRECLPGQPEVIGDDWTAYGKASQVKAPADLHALAFVAG